MSHFTGKLRGSRNELLWRLQHTATHCNTLQHTRYGLLWRLQHTATHCNTLQHTATHCNTLQHIWISHVTGKFQIDLAMDCFGVCNTLQPTATYCNTLQHTATHWSRKTMANLSILSRKSKCILKYHSSTLNRKIKMTHPYWLEKPNHTCNDTGSRTLHMSHKLCI